jgi:hypothetical protein
MSTPQDRANVSLGHFWLAKRCHPNNHAKRLALFERFELDPYLYEQQLRRVSEVISGDD